MELEIVFGLVQVTLLYLLADLVGGIFNWAEDTLGAETTPVWGPLFVAPNAEHHERPAAMVQKHWLINNIPIASAALAVFLLMFWLDALSWQVLTFICIGLLNQQVHRFSHTPQKRLPGVVRLLQRLRLIQDGRHHWVHHISPHSTRYCVLTPWMNPMLDRLGFWRCLERLFVPIFGAPRRNDLRVQPWYRPIAIWKCAD